MDTDSINLKKLLCVSSDTETKEKPERVSYSKETLMILSKNTPCQTRPECLSPECLGDDGLWDPERWHQSFDSASFAEGGQRLTGETAEKDPTENKLILGPQRRSFQGGCHVVSKEKSGLAFTRSNLSSAGSKLPGRLDRGGKLSRQQSQESDQHPPHVKRFHSIQNDGSDWSKKDVDGKRSFEKLEPAYHRKSKPSDYRRFASVSTSSSKFSDGYHNSRPTYYEEDEPEWISYGPKSQFDTIELTGFEEADDFSWMGGEIPMDDVPERKKKVKPKDKESEESLSKEKPPNKVDKKVISNEKVEPSSAKEEIVASTPDTKTEDENTGIASKPEEINSKEDPNIEKLHVNPEGIQSNGDSNQGSRFSRWFGNEVDTPPTPEPASIDIDLISFEKKLVDDLTSEEFSEEKSAPRPPSVVNAGLPQETSDFNKEEFKRPLTNSSSSDLHGTAAFNRLIASIRATDNKVKEQIQQRNQKMQALQSMMKASKARNSFNLSTIENAAEPVSKNFQSNSLKLQLEKQKDAYHQKIRQIEEQQQKSSPIMFSGQDIHSLQSNQGILSGFPGQSRNMQDVMDERMAATASLAAKLKGKKDDPNKMTPNVSLAERMYSNSVPAQTNALSEQALIEKDSLLKLKRLSSISADTTKSNTYPHSNIVHNLKTSSLAIAQMLAKSGVTEEQFKQLTFEQQEMVITMVQNQFTQNDIGNAVIGKFSSADLRNNLKHPENLSRTSKPLLSDNTLNNNTFGGVNNSKDLYSNKSLPSSRDVRQTPAANASASNVLSFLSDNSTALPLYNDTNASLGMATSAYQSPNIVQASTSQSRLLSRNTVMPIHPTIMSPVVPLVSPNITPHMLTPTVGPPHLTRLVQTPTPLAPPHPALLLQMQQQLYASQVAAAQQQQQVLVALQKQQQLAVAQAQSGDIGKLPQAMQGLKLGGSSNRPGTSDAALQDRAQFSNPLTQWFPGDVLRQSQFPPVSQLTGQQTMKLSNTPQNLESNNNKH